MGVPPGGLIWLDSWPLLGMINILYVWAHQIGSTKPAAIVFMHVWLKILPAKRTDSVYLYLLNVKYSLISSLINKFSLESTGLASD